MGNPQKKFHREIVNEKLLNIETIKAWSNLRNDIDWIDSHEVQCTAEG